jgi:hypothetical protein
MPRVKGAGWKLSHLGAVAAKAVGGFAFAVIAARVMDLREWLRR